ncbi:MAG: hypothetical protein GY809_17675 [Planctomycetes bacterium]|nr:hypothetical protein [Planctomycetota bacterium]
MTTPITVSGSSSYTFINDAALEYKIEITGIPAVGGTWTADPSIGTLPSGENTVNFTLQGVNVDISSMPAGMQMIAEIVFHAKPQNGTGN